MKKNISDIYDCFGCGVCTKPCPKHIVAMRLNSDGFYESYVTDESKCIECGLCRDVCSFIHDGLSVKNKPIISYAAWSNDKRVQSKCSSGGVGFEVAKLLLLRGYKIIGVRYNVKEGRAEHYMANTLEELVQSIGSKYIQSYTPDALSEIDRKGKYLFIGTPCQVDSFRRYIQRMKLNEDNFVLLDFFCHGTPSMLAWRKYLQMCEKKVGKITYVSWRNKWTGWHDSWAMGVDGEKHGEKVNWHDSYNLLIRGKKSFIQSRLSQGDIFYRLFLQDFCMNPACRKNCKYKYDKSSADIRIGDLWGKTYKDNEDGVSAAIAFTDRGHKVIDASDCHLKEHPFEIVAEGQMKHNCGKAETAFLVYPLLHSKNNIPALVWKIVLFPQRVINFFKWHLKHL
ncbi:MAG: Coenzyme F420 hydrogenase/dehydrogenase, beta subunit C-terminal domain [Prevotella sp.]|jgi:coenzyme F420-reducing hydrogenase beta subunit|nr:Coenzyme F420 hydrogenase/dehydrogenase, beta subunit C-terminal domain [Prevotella sp.]MCI2125838.1 Coenzyme F420 hydrogenase/dehydrogenase, beta subunit C-terminal domain [Prevotella sp.]